MPSGHERAQQWSPLEDATTRHHLREGIGSSADTESAAVLPLGVSASRDIRNTSVITLSYSVSIILL